MNGFETVTGFEGFDFGQGRSGIPGTSEHGVRIPESPGFLDQLGLGGVFRPRLGSIQLEEEVSKGDRVRLTFTMYVPFFQESQRSALVRAINADRRFRVLTSRVDRDRIMVDVEILESPFPLAILAGAVIAAGATVFLFLNFEKAEKLARAVSPIVWGIAALVGVVAFGRVFGR